MNITSVKLIFENCEAIDIPFNDILFLHIGKEYKKTHRTFNSLSIETVLKEFAIALNKYIECNFWNNQSIEERLAMRDITWVELCNNNEKVSYYIEWPEYDEHYSTAQRLQYTPDGNLIFTSSTQSFIKIETDDIDHMAKSIGIYGHEK